MLLIKNFYLYCMNITDLYKIFQKYPKITTDSRKPLPNSIFFAIKGENFDGNKFAEDALEVCRFAVVDDSDVVKNDRFILVDNALKTLQDLAKYHRSQFDIPVIAITGTNGKTTTKELTGKVLNKKYKTFVTRGNLNNHIGVPLSLLQITEEYEMAIIEMGASKSGDIKELCEIAAPTHGVITNVGKAHLEGFGSFETVMQTKGELYDYLYINNGTAFVNYDNEYLEDMNPPRKTIHYGVSRFTHCQGQIVKESPMVSFKWISTGEMVYDDAELNWSDNKRYIELNLVGSYNFENALAAVCIGNFFDVDDLDIKKALEEFIPGNYRSQLMQTENNQLIVDSYNANPTSMKLAIDDFIKFEANAKVLILGDMLELGRVSNREHDVIVHYLADSNNFEHVFFVGNEFLELKDDSTPYWFKNVDELSKHLETNKLKNKTILIKGSRGMKLEKVLPYL